MAAVALYGIFVLRDDERRGEAERGDAKAGGLRINRRIAKKAAGLLRRGLVLDRNPELATREKLQSSPTRCRSSTCSRSTRPAA